MLIINDYLSIPLSEIEFSATRSEGPGGQHVNKTNSAIELRFDINVSTLPEEIKVKLLKMRSHLITEGGVVIIKAQENRSLHRNKEVALERLKELILLALVVKKKRFATKPTKASKEKRLEGKKTRGTTKKMRGKVMDD